MDYSKKIQTLHLNIWKCENKYDDDGNQIGIIDGELNATHGVDYHAGSECAPEREISNHLVDLGYVQLMYVAQKFEVGAYHGDNAPVFNQRQWFGGYRLYTDRSYYSRSNL